MYKKLDSNMLKMVSIRLLNFKRFHVFFQHRTICNLFKRPQQLETNILVDKKELIRFQTTRNFQPSRMQVHPSIKRYGLTAAMMTLGFSFGAGPLYKVFCERTGFAKDRPYKLRLNTDVAGSFPLVFKPEQTHVYIRPGEGELIFFSAENQACSPLNGITSYNIHPSEAGQYIFPSGCDCFVRHTLKEHEKISVPLIVSIDPEIKDDPFLQNIDEIVFSYTFREAPLPDSMSSK